MSAFNHSLRLGAASMLVMLLGSYVFATDANAEENQDISRVNRGINVGSDERVGDLSSVNGGVSLAENARAGEISTVNGSIDLDDASQVEEASTVNGGISVGSNVVITGSLETVNGSITTRSGTVVGTNIESVNGRVRIRDTRVNDNIETSNGNIDITDGSVVEGDVVIEGRRRWWDRFFDFNNRVPELTIDSESSVLGDIHLYRETELNIADGVVAGEIIEHF